MGFFDDFKKNIKDLRPDNINIKGLSSGERLKSQKEGGSLFSKIKTFERVDDFFDRAFTKTTFVDQTALIDPEAASKRQKKILHERQRARKSTGSKQSTLLTDPESLLNIKGPRNDFGSTSLLG